MRPEVDPVRAGDATLLAASMRHGLAGGGLHHGACAGAGWSSCRIPAASRAGEIFALAAHWRNASMFLPRRPMVKRPPLPRRGRRGSFSLPHYTSMAARRCMSRMR